MTDLQIDDLIPQRDCVKITAATSLLNQCEMTRCDGGIKFRPIRKVIGEEKTICMGLKEMGMNPRWISGTYILCDHAIEALVPYGLSIQRVDGLHPRKPSVEKPPIVSSNGWAL
jgi:hypothetical protein